MYGVISSDSSVSSDDSADEADDSVLNNYPPPSPGYVAVQPVPITNLLGTAEPSPEGDPVSQEEPKEEAEEVNPEEAVALILRGKALLESLRSHRKMSACHQRSCGEVGPDRLSAEAHTTPAPKRLASYAENRDTSQKIVQTATIREDWVPEPGRNMPQASRRPSMAAACGDAAKKSRHVSSEHSNTKMPSPTTINC